MRLLLTTRVLSRSPVLFATLSNTVLLSFGFGRLCTAVILALSRVEYAILGRNGCWMSSTECTISKSLQSVMSCHSLFVQQQPKRSRSRKRFLKPARRSSMSIAMTAMAQCTNSPILPWSSQLRPMPRHTCAVGAIPTRESHSPLNLGLLTHDHRMPGAVLSKHNPKYCGICRFADVYYCTWRHFIGRSTRCLRAGLHRS